jgi:alanine-alpha-ketoisovalerate/valine-pyruvate aminotransferase
MAPAYSPMNAMEILELYFIENRARLLDMASFLDRIDRHPGAEAARQDFRYRALMEAVLLLATDAPGRTAAIQNSFSDQTTELLESAAGLKAVGAWDGGAP